MLLILKSTFETDDVQRHRIDLIIRFDGGNYNNIFRNKTLFN